jgi:transposase
MATDTVALSLRHPQRSQDAFVALLEDGQGILGSAGYGVYHDWVHHRPTCLAHLMRTARGWSARRDPALAACGTWALTEWQGGCAMATAPPTGGQWRAG